MKEMLRSPEKVNPFKKSPEEIKIEHYNKDDEQFWNYKHETHKDENGDLVRFKSKTRGQPELYEWNPCSTHGYFLPCNSFPISAEPSGEPAGFVIELGDAQIESIQFLEPKTMLPLIQSSLCSMIRSYGNIGWSSNQSFNLSLFFTYCCLQMQYGVSRIISPSSMGIWIWQNSRSY